jgi:aryl-alcohol dehydrogenase-like predicted oxidoreductase
MEVTPVNTQPLDSVSLGSTDLRVSRIGIGTNSWNDAGKPNPALKSAFQTAQELGINWFDTAEFYGLGGSERQLGEIMRVTNQTPIIATKFLPLPWRLTESSLASALNQSLKRLQTTRVALYQIHFPLPPRSIETWANALADAVQAGFTLAVGVSNYNASQVKRAYSALARRGISLASNQVEYSLLKRDVERNGLLALCRELNVTVIAYRPLAMGLLSGRYSRENPPRRLRAFLYGRRYLTKIEPLLAELRRTGEGHGKTPSQVALNWLICKGALPIPGATSAVHVRENAGALGWRMNDDEVTALDRASEKLR